MLDVLREILSATAFAVAALVRRSRLAKLTQAPMRLADRLSGRPSGRRLKRRSSPV
jgi:hypothetical protein